MLMQVPDLTSLDVRYDALRREAYARGWPAAYRDDLHKHDRNYLAQNPEANEFLWILREYGTHLYLKPDTRAAWEWIQGAFSAGVWEHRLLYHYKNETLSGVGDITPILNQWESDLPDLERTRKKRRPKVILGYGVEERIAEIRAHAPEEGLDWEDVWEKFTGSPLEYDPTRIHVGLDFCPWSFTFLRERWIPREGVRYPDSLRFGEWRRDYNGGLIFDARSRTWRVHT